MKNIKIYGFLAIGIAGGMLISSCMKDLGNYDYHDINRISIQGLDSTYYADYHKQLTISPQLQYSMDEKFDSANYTYRWVADHLLGYTMQPILLSKKKVLDTIINLNFGAYSCYYRVTDNRTGVFTDHYFTLSIGGPAYEGWMFLCDAGDGTSRLDMVSSRGTGDTLYRNILKELRSEFPMDAPPVFINTGFVYLTSPPNNGALAIALATQKTMAMLGPDTLEYLPSYNLGFMLSDDTDHDYNNADMLMGSYAGIFYYKNNLQSMGWGSISSPVNRVDGGQSLFSCSPYIGYSYSYNSACMVFNQDTRTFLRYPGSGTTCLSLPTGELFDYQINMELLYMEYVSFNGGEVFALLRNEDKKVFLARFSLNGTIQNYYQEIHADGIDKAGQFAVNPDFGYIFYAADNKLYEYDSSLDKSIEMADYGTRQINLIKFQHFSSTYESAPNAEKYINLSKKLVVATSDSQDADHTGKVDLFNVPDINGKIDLYKTYEGTGKVVSIAYRER